MKRLYNHVQQQAEAVVDTARGVVRGTTTALVLYVPPHLMIHYLTEKILGSADTDRERQTAYRTAQAVHKVGNAARTILSSQ